MNCPNCDILMLGEKHIRICELCDIYIEYYLNKFYKLTYKSNGLYSDFLITENHKLIHIDCEINDPNEAYKFLQKYLWIDIFFYNCDPTMRIVNNKNIVVHLNEPIKDYFQVYKILEKYKDNIIFE